MIRRNFLRDAGIGLGALMLGGFGCAYKDKETPVVETQPNGVDFVLGPNTQINEYGVPSNLDSYVKKVRSTSFFSDSGLAELATDVPALFRFDFAYFIHQKDWDHYFVIDVGLPWLPIVLEDYMNDHTHDFDEQPNITKSELHYRVDLVTSALLRSLDKKEVDVHSGIEDHFKSLSRVEGATLDDRDFIRMELKK